MVILGNAATILLAHSQTWENRSSRRSSKGLCATHRNYWNGVSGPGMLLKLVLCHYQYMYLNETVPYTACLEMVTQQLPKHNFAPPILPQIASISKVSFGAGGGGGGGGGKLYLVSLPPRPWFAPLKFYEPWYFPLSCYILQESQIHISYDSGKKEIVTFLTWHAQSRTYRSFCKNSSK